jgi:hypothetical protein
LANGSNSQCSGRARGRTLLAGILLVALGLGGPSYAEANGVKFGEGRLHPFLGLDFRYDSAAAMVTSADGSSPIAGDLVVRLKPGLKLEIPSPNFAVGLNGNLDYVWYTGIVSDGSSNASHFEGEANLDLGINRGGQLSLDIGDYISRSDRLVTSSIVVGALSLFNDAKLQLNYRPSGGALVVEPSYHLISEFFSPWGQVAIKDCPSEFICDPEQVGQTDYLNHGFGLSARWKFLPKTAATFDAGFGIRSYLGSIGTDSSNLKASVGLSGLVSPHISTTLKFGWAHDFSTGSFSSPIGQADVGYIFSQTGQVHAGYVRTFDPVASPVAVAQGTDRGYLDARFLLAGQLTARGNLSANWLDLRAADGSKTFSYLHFVADLGADYEVSKWLSLSGGYTFNLNQSVMGLSSFNRSEVYLRAQFIY